jgi:hypothetical protein
MQRRPDSKTRSSLRAKLIALTLGLLATICAVLLYYNELASGGVAFDSRGDPPGGSSTTRLITVPQGRGLERIPANSTSTALEKNTTSPPSKQLIVRLERELSNTPITNTLIQVTTSAKQGLGVERQVRITDSDGNAAFQCVTGQVRILINGSDPRDISVDCSESQVVLISLPERLSMSGIVTDSHGSPVPDAQVWLADGKALCFQAPSCYSSKDGLFELPWVNDHSAVIIRHEDYWPKLVSPPRDQSQLRLVITLDARERVSVVGRVMSEFGGPLPDIDVVLLCKNTGAPRSSLERHIREVRLTAKTDFEGKYEFGGFDQLTGQIIIGSAPFPSQCVDVELPAAGRKQLDDLFLPSGVAISGTVRDASSLLAIDGATVHLIPADGRWLTQSVRTDNSGAFQFPSVPRCPYALSVEHDRYVSFLDEYDTPAGDGKPNLVLLEGGSGIHGQVRLSGPCGASFVLVVAVLPNDHSTWVRFARVAPGARFSLDGLKDGVYDVLAFCDQQVEAGPIAAKPGVRTGDSSVLLESNAIRPKASLRLLIDRARVSACDSPVVIRASMPGVATFESTVEAGLSLATLGPMPLGVYEVTVLSEFSETLVFPHITVGSDQDQLKVQLRPGGRVLVEMRRSAVGGPLLISIDDGRSVRTDMPFRTARQLTGPLPVGEYRVWVSARHKLWEGYVSVLPCEVTTVTID